jgi:uncharacterized protein (TIGR03437 family)
MMTPLRSWVVAAFVSGAVWGAADTPAYSGQKAGRGIAGRGAVTAAAPAPSYTAAGIVSTCNGAPGPFAPNMGVTIRGAALAFSARALTDADISTGRIPTSLNGVRVFVDGFPAPIFYVSESQVNFLIPANELAGQSTVWLVRESVAGPQVQITLLNAAPALFPSATAPGYAIAQLWPAYSLMEPDAPAPGGGIVILYAAGLGETDYFPLNADEIPLLAGRLKDMKNFRVYLNGAALDPAMVLYAGICPGWAGLYQINFFLPFDAGTDPEIRLGTGERLSAPGLKLAVR